MKKVARERVARLGSGGVCAEAEATIGRTAERRERREATCERVFALVKTMFGEQQLSTLADYIKAALMLRVNDRAVG